MPTTTDDQPDAPPSTRRRALLIALFSISAVVLVLDQASKAWAISSLVEGERHDLVGNLLGFQLVFNPGAALSIATGMTWVLTIVAAVVIVVVVRASRRIGSWAWAVALGLLLGGALGNLVDRLVREPGVARGEVVDFIAYANWFVGNVADIAIVIGGRARRDPRRGSACTSTARATVTGTGASRRRGRRDGRRHADEASTTTTEQNA